MLQGHGKPDPLNAHLSYNRIRHIEHEFFLLKTEYPETSPNSVRLWYSLSTDGGLPHGLGA